MQHLVSPVVNDSRIPESEDDGIVSEEPQEYTSLLPHYRRRRRSTLTPIFVSFMLTILIIGIIIGIHLLIEQDKEWPISLPFVLVFRESWGAKPSRWPSRNLTTKAASHVILSHTATNSCTDVYACEKIIFTFQNSTQSLPLNMSDVPFNFMIGSSGETFEGRGWGVQGRLDPLLDDVAISIAAIGNYTAVDPPSLILQEISSFIDESIRCHKLISNYTLVGRAFMGSPKRLLLAVSKWPHWSRDAGSED